MCPVTNLAAKGWPTQEPHRAAAGSTFSDHSENMIY